MTTDRWRRIEEIYHAALERETSDRAAFVAEACAGDEALHAEVQSLLGYEDGGGFLETPALEEAATNLVTETAPPPTQRRLGGYEILSPLGAGGMGEVYRAKDLRLGREIALKVLSSTGGPGDLRRFEEEARLASGLNHPNIVTIYGVGETLDQAYIAMELVRGRTLRQILATQPLSVKETLDLVVQLADALAAAHASGIIHRDLKPENLMVTPEGLLKVLDFGIAKLLGSQTLTTATDAARAETARTNLTETGTILGTVGYMSPEQAAGEPANHASDQFNFGAILYEMLSGRRAFQKSTKVGTLAAIIKEEPEPIQNLNTEVSAPLRDVLARCLAKDPAARYASTSDLSAELHRIQDQWDRDEGAPGLTRRHALWLAAAAAVVAAVAGLAFWRLWPRDTGVRSLAVLSFTNTLKDADAQYLCDGIAESLIRDISRLPSLTVKPRRASFHFKGKDVDPRDAGRQLGADAVVAGSVTLRSGRLHITAELVEVATGARLWSAAYDRAAADFLSIQEEIATAIIDEGVRIRLSSDERNQLARSPTRDPAAFELYLRGIHGMEDESESSLLGARDLLTRAIAKDQGFALAYVALASTHTAMAINGYEAPAEAWPEVTRNVRRALDFDPDQPDAHSEAASALFYSQWDWAGAEQEWNRALQSRGGGIVPDFLGARALQRWALGRTDEALQLARRARELDPLSAGFIFQEANFLLQNRQLEDAASLYERLIRTDPGYSRAYFGLAEVRRVQGRFDEAIDARRRGYKAAGDDSLTTVFSTARGADGYQQIEKAAARLELDALQARAAEGAYTSPFDVARAYAQLGDKEHAFASLDAALAERSPGLVFLNADRAWDAVRDDPRFLSVVRHVGLPSSR